MERNKASRPQEVLDLVHERQLGPIDRRSFLHGAGRFAVGGLTAGWAQTEFGRIVWKTAPAVSPPTANRPAPWRNDRLSMGPS